MAELDIAGYRRAVEEYEDSFHVLDDVLYSVCDKHPHHVSWGSICAKLWMIGRTYSTGIERQVRSRGTPGSSMTQIAEHFLSHGRVIDGLIDRVRRLQEPLTPAKLSEIVCVHGRFMNLLRPICRRKQCPRSFVSKYLHFHCAVVPIFDNVAARHLPSIIRWERNLLAFDLSSHSDETYGWYVMRFFRLYQKFKAVQLPVTVKHVDYFLLSTAGAGTARPSGKVMVVE